MRRAAARFKKLHVFRQLGLVIGLALSVYELVLLGLVLSIGLTGTTPAYPALPEIEHCGLLPSGALPPLLQPSPACDAPPWFIGITLAGIATVLIFHASWSRSRHPQPEVLLTGGCLALILVILHPYQPDNRLPPVELLTAGTMLGLFIAAGSLALLPLRRSLAPEFAILAFLVLMIGGTLVRDLRSVPGFTGQDEIPVRVTTRDLATGAAFLRPGELVRLRFAKAGELDSQTFANLRVVGLYAADGHSVAYTGELPDNVLISVTRDQADAVLAALAQKKQPLYLEGQSTLEQTPSPAPTVERRPVALLLPTGKVRVGDPALIGGANSVLVVVDDSAATAQASVSQTHFYNAVVSMNYDATAYIATLDNGYTDTDIKNLAEQLVTAHDIYVLARQIAEPTPTPPARVD